MLKKILFFGLILSFSSAFASDLELRRKIIKKLGVDTKIDSIQKTPYGGLYEVYMNDRLHYADKDFNFMIIGSLIDIDKNINYSGNSLRKLTTLPLSTLPPKNQAIFTQKGQATTNSKKQTVYIFSDPLCGHCREFEDILQRFPELEIYVYLMPNDAVNRGSSRMSKAIWCSDNPAQKYLDYMRKGIIPDEKIKLGCELQTADIVKSAEEYGFRGTPAIVFEDGYPVFGKIPEPRLRSLLRNTKVSAK